MTPDQIRLVRQSFAEVPDTAALAENFYARLFAADPSIRPLFPADLRAQGTKLMAMLAVVVNGLERIDTLIPAIEGLARRHVGYGVVDRHYPTVGAALVRALEQGLGARFLPEVRAAWVAAYGVLSTTMIRAARAAIVLPNAA